MAHRGLLTLAVLWLLPAPLQAQETADQRDAPPVPSSTQDATDARIPRPRPPSPNPEYQNQTSAELLLARAQAAILAHRYRKARDLLAAAQALGADRATILVWQARIALEQGDWAKADSLYEALAATRPNDARTLLTLARLDFKLGKYIWAMRRFQRAAQDPRVQGEARLGLARTLIKMEEFADAARQADLAARSATRPKTRRQAKALAALCRYRLDRIRAARKDTLAAGDGPTTRRLAGLLVERLVGPQPQWVVHASAGLGTDSNPTMGPEPVVGWTDSNQAAMDLTIQADAQWNPVVRAAHHLSLQGSVTRHFYFAPWDRDIADQVSSFDMTTLSVAGDYFRRKLTKAGLDSLRLGYRFDLVELDGGPGIPTEPNAFLYSERHRLVVGWDKRWDRANLDLRFEPAYAAFRDKDRDGPSMSLITSASRFFLGRRLRLYGKASVEWSHARWEPWRWIGLGMWAAVSYLGPWKLDVVGWSSYDFHDHFQSADAFPKAGQNPWGLPSGTQRRDHLLTLAVGLGRRIDRDSRWRMDLNLRYQTSRSNAEFFTYSRLVAMLSVTGRIGQ